MYIFQINSYSLANSTPHALFLLTIPVIISLPPTFSSVAHTTKYPIKLKNKKSIIAHKKLKKSKKKISYKPDFTWPLKNIKTYTHDGINGVKPIGIIITGKQNAGVTTSASGIVKKIGYMRGFGNYIIIKHKGRFATVYSNLKKIVVKEGEEVKVGTMIGYVGNNKKLHFQIDYEGRPDDPLKYLPKNS